MPSSMEKIALKKLSKTDIEKRLTIPRKSLSRFPPLRGKHTVDFKARDESGHDWKFRIYTRKNNEYLKPVLTKGWREFVCSKELRVGDRVVFYKENEQAGAGKFRVEVEKGAQIFGDVFSHKPIHSDTNSVQNQETILPTRDQVGDRAVFCKENEQAKYSVEGEKAVKIFGAVFARKPIHSDKNPVQKTRDQARPKRTRKASAWTKDFIMGWEPKLSK